MTTDSTENPYVAPAHTSDTALTPKSRKPLSTLRAVLYSGFLGLAVGIWSRIVRPWIPGAIHYESIVGGLILVIVCVAVSRRAAQRNSGSFLLVVAVSGTTWLTYAVGWTLINGEIWEDIFGAALSGAAVSAIAASVALQVSTHGEQF